MTDVQRIPAGLWPQIDIAVVCDRSIMRAAVGVVRRLQSVEIDRIEVRPLAPVRPRAIVRILARSIREVVDLSTRKCAITVALNDDAILLKGRNPLELPVTELDVDQDLAEIAKRQGIEPRLSWEHGLGPVMSLRFASAR